MHPKLSVLSDNVTTKVLSTPFGSHPDNIVAMEFLAILNLVCVQNPVLCTPKYGVFPLKRQPTFDGEY